MKNFKKKCKVYICHVKISLPAAVAFSALVAVVVAVAAAASFPAAGAQHLVMDQQKPRSKRQWKRMEMQAWRAAEKRARGKVVGPVMAAEM